MPNLEPRAPLGSTFSQTLIDATESQSRRDTYREVSTNEGRPTLPTLSAWDYSRELQDSSRPRRNPVATVAVVVCVVALSVLLYGYRDVVGQYLISLGQKMSPPPQTTSTQPAAVQPPAQSTNAKPASDSPQALTTASAQETPRQSAPEPGSASAASPVSAPTVSKSDVAAPNKPVAEAQFVDVPRNLSPGEQARSLWSAVAQGNTSAEVALAKLYLIGGGVTKNCDQAKVLLQAAAKKGNGEAIDKLSQLQNQGCP